MKVIYHSAFVTCELTRDCTFNTIPCKSYLQILPDKNDQEYNIILDGAVIENDLSHIDCNSYSELVIFYPDKKYTYSIHPIYQPLPAQDCQVYKQFSLEYNQKPGNEIESIETGYLRMYAVDQCSEVKDWSSLFMLLDDSFFALKSISDNPKSHLKATNEVRPIETVKRIGYESIPYLASHSEDWLARTASGLKPARLFSRVEDDDYQIYENRVVKTLIDKIIDLLRKIEKELKDQYEKMDGIININVDSFGFDASFQRCLSELLVSDETADEARRSQVFQLVTDLHEHSLRLLKKYRTLRATKLYRYLRRSKPVSNPLNETNILLMDKLYKQAFSVWNAVHKETLSKIIDFSQYTDFIHAYDDYLLFCKTLCGYAAHSLEFDITDDGRYFRYSDDIELKIDEMASGYVQVDLLNKSRSSMPVYSRNEIPLSVGEQDGSFFFDGKTLFWDSNVTEQEVKQFCAKLQITRQTGSSRASADEKKAISNQQRLEENSANELRKRIYNATNKRCRIRIAIVPAMFEMESGDTPENFTAALREKASYIIENCQADKVIFALPKCEKYEKEIINYAPNIDDNTLILLLNMLDINSYRRIQKVLLSQILSFNEEKCPCCGGKARKQDGRFICDSCGKLILTKTTCTNPECRHDFSFLSYDTTVETIDKMKDAEQNGGFYKHDSLYQYKNVVTMQIDGNKVRALCPYCQHPLA